MQGGAVQQARERVAGGPDVELGLLLASSHGGQHRRAHQGDDVGVGVVPRLGVLVEEQADDPVDVEPQLHHHPVCRLHVHAAPAVGSVPGATRLDGGDHARGGPQALGVGQELDPPGPARCGSSRRPARDALEGAVAGFDHLDPVRSDDAGERAEDGGDLVTQLVPVDRGALHVDTLGERLELGAAAFDGDLVLDRAKGEHHPRARLVGDGRRRHPRVDVGAVTPADADAGGDVVPVVALGLVQRPHGHHQVVGVDVVADRVAQHLAALEPEEPFDRGVGPHGAQQRVDHDEQVRRQLGGDEGAPLVVGKLPRAQPIDVRPAGGQAGLLGQSTFVADRHGSEPKEIHPVFRPTVRSCPIGHHPTRSLPLASAR